MNYNTDLSLIQKINELIPQEDVRTPVLHCIGGYSVLPTRSVCQILRDLIYRIFNTMKAIFGISDWQVARKGWVDYIVTSKAPTSTEAQKQQFVQELIPIVDKALADFIALNEKREGDVLLKLNEIKFLFQQRCHQVFLPEITLAPELASIAVVVKARNHSLQGDTTLMQDSLEGSREWSDYGLIMKNPDAETDKVMGYLMDEIGHGSKSHRQYQFDGGFRGQKALEDKARASGSGVEVVTEELLVTGYDITTKKVTLGTSGVPNIKMGCIFFKDRTAPLLLRLFNDRVSYHPEIRRQMKPKCLLPELWKIVEDYLGPWPVPAAPPPA